MIDVIENYSDDFRKLAISKFLIYATFIVASTLSIYNFFTAKMTLFYIDAVLFFIFLFMFLMFRKKNILLVAKSVSLITAVGILFVTYFNSGNDNVMLWAYTIFPPLMFLFGFRKGALISSIYCIILFLLCFIWVGENITYQEYIRFVFVGILLAMTAYFYEYSIHKTLEALKSSNSKLNELAKTDALTALYNKRYFNELFPKEIKIAKRENKILVFAMIDIDCFKGFNDTYGHLAGDYVLKETAKSFKENLKRPDDYVFRLGGEEFGILFKTDSKEDGIALIEKVRKCVEDLKIAHSENLISPYVTVSIGLFIQIPHKYLEYDDIYQSSDDALYQAKSKGKNRVEIV